MLKRGLSRPDNVLYEGLAGIYDYLVSGVDFTAWIEYVLQMAARHDLVPRSVLDLACGTGQTLLPLARRGCRCSGLDLSPAMLEVARRRAEQENLTLQLYQMDMRCFELPEKVDLVTCFHDGLNYLLDWSELVATFACVRRVLRPGGLFIFDLNTLFWCREGGSEPVVVDEDDFTLIYRTCCWPERREWEIDLLAFIRRGESYVRQQEKHRERAYSSDEVRRALQQAGLLYLDSFDAFTFAPPRPDSRRVFYVARCGCEREAAD